MKENLTYIEARKRYYDDKKKVTTTYASIVQKATEGCDVTTQTPPLNETLRNMESFTLTYVDEATQTTEPYNSCGLTIRPYIPRPQ